MPTLNWIGKEKVINHHRDVPFKILEHVYGFNNGDQTKEETYSGNKIIHGDNLEALKALLPQYEGQINCIYIDPPYNTGNENWVYNDNVNDPKINKWLGQVVGKEAEDLSRHDKWLCMMYPRLKLLHKLLSKDGAIFVSIDDNEQSNLKLICDDIFGYQNCIGPIIQNKMNAKNDTVDIQKNHEFILVYRKKSNLISKTKIKPTLINSDNKIKEVFEEDGEYYFINDAITTRGQGGILNARPNLGFTIYYNSISKDKIAVCDYDIELAKISNDENQIYSTDTELISRGYCAIRAPKVRGKLGCWTWSLDKFNNEKRDIIITGKSNSFAVKKRSFVNAEEVYKENNKFYLKADTTSNSRSILDYSTNDGTNVLNEIMNIANVFDNPKNLEMIEYLIKLTPSKKGIVLDSFAGSGTTAQAVLNINKKDGGNRKFILVELEDYAEKITAERIKKVIKGYDFKGNKRTELASFTINITNLKKADKIIDLYNEFKMDENFSEITIESSKGNIVINGNEEIEGKIEGIEGCFDFYELGKSLFVGDNREFLNEEVDIEKIREYIWYSETRSPYKQASHKKDWHYLLGRKEDTAIYFIYEKESVTTIDYDSLSNIKTKAGQYILYADNCLLPRDFMLKNNITFKKIPRDVTRF